jgi:hypothetical protein
MGKQPSSEAAELAKTLPAAAPTRAERNLYTQTLETPLKYDVCSEGNREETGQLNFSEKTSVTDVT